MRKPDKLQVEVLGREGDFLLKIAVDDDKGVGIPGIDILIHNGGPVSPQVHTTRINGVIFHKIKVEKNTSRKIVLTVIDTDLSWEKTIHYSDDYE